MIIKRRYIVLSVVMTVLLTSRSVPASEIFSAVGSRDVAAIKKLLAADPGVVSETTPGGATPLHNAAGLNNVEIVNLFISIGADVNARTKKGYTPLHWAAYMNAGKTAEILVGKGADPKIKTLSGMTPLNIAVKENASDVVSVLTRKTSTTYTDKFLNPIYSDGEQARKAGDLKRAYDIFSKLVKEDPENEKINFTYGLTCFSMKDYSRARLAFERVLDKNPANDRARVDLGRTYMEMNQPILARNEFETVLSHNPPENVRKNIEGWLKLAKSGGGRWLWRTRFDGGWFYDDNVNVGPDSENISISPIIFGSQIITELTLDESSRPNESPGSFVSLSSSAVCDAGERGHWAFTFDGAYYQNWLEDARDYESLFGQVVTGARKFAGKSMINLPVKIAHITNGHEPLVNIYGITPAVFFVAGNTREWQWGTTLTGELRDYDALNDRDGVFAEISESMKYSFGKQGHSFMIGVSVFHDFTAEQVYEHTGVTWKLGAQLVLPAESTLYARVSHASSDYVKKEILSVEKRSDTQNQFLVGLNKRIGSRFGVDVNHQVSNNDSTFGLYQYDRTVTTLSASVSF